MAFTLLASLSRDQVESRRGRMAPKPTEAEKRKAKEEADAAAAKKKRKFSYSSCIFVLEYKTLRLHLFCIVVTDREFDLTSVLSNASMPGRLTPSPTVVEIASLLPDMKYVKWFAK